MVQDQTCIITKWSWHYFVPVVHMLLRRQESNKSDWEKCFGLICIALLFINLEFKTYPLAPHGASE